jgi:cell division protease FtsH
MYEQRKFSEHMLQVIDEEIANILHAAAERAEGILKEHRQKLDKLAQALVEQEEVNDREISELIGPSVHEINGANSAGKGELAAKKSVSKSDL